ncbi:Glycosyl hydrolases family 43 [Aspergillus parasiticus SU-1]|uniref:Glycosyl hydrolase n=2 Tax=Aspergillus parasiticus TaxID=5067 RepID=A0A5N6DZC9_ASPPA|nr:glycosyl hydrolase [Aspergillus parasiticus]KJK61586.1 Glycosyl hydrolases family 43 [Aspergillus parasiticus SU-1]
MTPSLSKIVALSLFLGTALGEPWKAINADFPDPSVIKTDDGYYAFATTANGVNTQIAHSADFKTWNVLDGQDALPGPFPSWVNGSHPKVWAPDVIQRNDGTFVIYYSAATSGTGSKHCIGAATSSSVTGPYSPVQDVLACDKSKGGAIDAAGFKDDDGTYYVVYKVDGNSLNEEGSGYHPTPIMLQKLKSDAVTPDGDAKQLIDRDDADGPLVEAPSLVKSGGQYYLSFSSNWYNSLNYDVSYAVASTVTGPYTKASAPDAPLLVSGDSSNVGALGGPGGSDFREDGGAIVFHAFNNGKNMTKGRGMWAANVKIDGGKISIQ